MVSPRARDRLGDALFSRVAGPSGAENRARIHDTPGPRWFAPQEPIRRVHGDASMFVGGLTALLLQSLHPRAMAAVEAHSGYRGDPWGRLQRTSTFLAFTTYGTVEDAQLAVDGVRAVHARISGRTPDGDPYRADDPHLLEWVHIAEVDSFLRAYQRYGAQRLREDECDAYVASTARVGRALGMVHPPRTTDELAERIDAFRPELRGTEAARSAARFILLSPPLPWPARPPYAMLAAAAVALLPPWARAPLNLPLLPRTERWCAAPAGAAVTAAIRWAMHRPPQPGGG
ncbi:oxygenase MpaB family protein [Streptomyces sp. 2RAF24]|uniref:oxygenase MpaB family protein n=1 Tax=unclassified Streptomyces TaxID=2593676 RepID=UPI0033F33D7B